MHTAGAAARTGGQGEGIGLSPGKVGMLGLILSEVAFFATFIVTYLFYVGRSLNPPYPDRS